MKNKKTSCFIIPLILAHLLLTQIGCMSWFKSGGNDNPELALQDGVPPLDSGIRFSENQNVGAFNEKKYKKMTRKSLEEESELDSKAGSLWSAESPSSYLFAQNKLHRDGDLLNVKLEGAEKSQVDTKIKVLKKLLARIEIINTPTSPLAEGENGALTGAARDPATVDQKNTKDPNNLLKSSIEKNKTESSLQKPLEVAGPENESEMKENTNIESIQTKVVERQPDGSYRVKGQKSFMLGKKEFRVILMGFVRAEDFSDEGISSNKLVDSQIDVVSLKRGLE